MAIRVNQARVDQPSEESEIVVEDVPVTANEFPTLTNWGNLNKNGQRMIWPGMQWEGVRSA